MFSAVSLSRPANINRSSARLVACQRRLFFLCLQQGDQALLSLEELARLYNVVDSPIDALDLEAGMVLRFEGKVRIVISIAFENSESGPTAIIETSGGLNRVAASSQVKVWHLEGSPFIVDPPPEDFGKYKPDASSGNSSPPAQDAAGIVPVWRGPKRYN
jgi:hypothetical protein